MLSNPPKKIDCKKFIAHIYIFIVQLIAGIINTIKQVIRFLLEHFQKYYKWIAEIIKYIKHLLCPNKPKRTVYEYKHQIYPNFHHYQQSHELYQ